MSEQFILILPIVLMKASRKSYHGPPASNNPPQVKSLDCIFYSVSPACGASAKMQELLCDVLLVTSQQDQGKPERGLRFRLDALLKPQAPGTDLTQAGSGDVQTQQGVKAAECVLGHGQHVCKLALQRVRRKPTPWPLENAAEVRTCALFSCRALCSLHQYCPVLPCPQKEYSWPPCCRCFKKRCGN